MSQIKALLNQSSHYFIGQLVAVAAGFISFPILTRILSVSDYGALSFLTTTLLIGIAITKFGFVGSAIRFYSEFKSKNQLSNFRSTIILSSIALAAIICIFFELLTHVIEDLFPNKYILNLFPLILTLIFISSATDIFTSFLRAEERTKLYNLIAILRRYGSLFLGIFFVFFVFKGLFGFFLGQIIAGAILFLLLFYSFNKKDKIRIKNFSVEILKQSIRFGFPLIWGELGHLVLNYIDRYLIQMYLGSFPLGIYSAGYNLATYVAEMIMYPINYAMIPIFLGILENEGEEKTRHFFTKSLTYFLLIMLPIVFGFIAIGKDLISLLATKKYLESYPIMVYVIIGQAIYACSIILNCGLWIRKKTTIYAYVMLISCFWNIGLNMILIPRFGIVGAALATLITNTFYVVVITYYSFKEFSFPIDYPRILLYLGIGGAMYLVISAIDVGAPISNLIARISAGAVFYSGLVLILDKEVRGAIFRVISRSRAAKFPAINN